MKTRLNWAFAFLGGWLGLFWVVGTVWESFAHKPPVSVTLLSAGLIAAVGVTIVQWIVPNALTIPTSTDWGLFIGGIVAGGMISYPILALASGGLAELVLPVDTADRHFVAFFSAIWFPIWFLPCGGALFASLVRRREAAKKAGQQAVAADDPAAGTLV